MHTFLTTSYITFLVCCAITISWWNIKNTPEITVQNGHMKECPNKELRAAMRYHGTDWAKQDEMDGEWYFWRGKNKIKLFCHLEKQ